VLEHLRAVALEVVDEVQRALPPTEEPLQPGLALLEWLAPDLLAVNSRMSKA
jgi:hypothetical protein